MRLTPKITLIFVLFALALLLVIGVFAYGSGRAALQAAVISDLLSTALEKQAALDSWVTDRRDGVVTLAESSDFVKSLEVFLTTPPQSAQAQRLSEAHPTEVGCASKVLWLDVTAIRNRAQRMVKPTAVG
jgi:hypothetical protein